MHQFEVFDMGLLLLGLLLVLLSPLQHLHASRHYDYSPSPLPTNYPGNEEQIVNEGGLVKEKTQQLVQGEKDVTVANKFGAGGGFGGPGCFCGGGFGGPGCFCGGGFGGCYCGRGFRGGGLGSAGVGFGLGYLSARHHHHHHHSQAVSDFWINPYYQFLATIIVLAKLILAN